MKITRYHDDRLNPERETLAAAKLLRSNYETLGDWPLAITAYNYGTGGVARAAGIYGGDYSQMVQHYQGPHFGFAVKNYYAEFLAAMQVHRYEDKYFPGIEDEPAIRPARVKTDFAPPKRSKKSHASHAHRASSLLRSRYYVPTMERIFRTAGLPPELVTLAHVESGFHGASRSSAGAVGIWQFTRGTGKRYMKITRYHDDRLNPERETRAAAQLLRSNYETLGDWPLAITAYNYGTSGVARAAGIYGGDYSQMVRHYQGPHFGFAVKNYYAEFLAAMQVHRYEDKYFPGIEDEPGIRPAPIKTDFAPKRSKKTHASHTHRASSKAHHPNKTVAQTT